MRKRPDTTDPMWFLTEGGITGASAREVDWSKTPLGPPVHWPQSLKSTVAMLLHSRHPMFLWWGEELIQFYNDAYLPSIGADRHPMAIGQRGEDCWQEIWPIIWPQIEGVMQRGEASWNEDHLVPIYRNERLEEVYWTYGYSPVYDDNGSIGGTLVVCTETTARVVSERRLQALQGLAEAASASSAPSVLIDKVAAALGQYPNDVPFALIYNDGPGGLQRVSSVGLDPATLQELERQIAPQLRDRKHAASSERDQSRVIKLQVNVVTEPWPESITQAYVAYLPVSVAENAHGWAVFGVSPRLPLSVGYQQHFEHLAERISQSLARRWAELEREALLRKVRAEQERLANLFAQAPAFMCVLEGPRHVFTLANERYYELIGHRDIIGKTVIEVMPEVEGQGFIELLDRVYRSGESYIGTSVPVQLAGNPEQPSKHLFLDLVYQAFRDPDGSIVGIVVHGVDQTERHRAEQAMRDTDRRKDKFLAILAHELRNPLAPIANYAQTLALVATDPEAVTRASSAMQRQVGQLVRLIDDLLDVSRISSGKIQLRRATVDMVYVLQQAIEATRPHYVRRGQMLEFKAPSTSVYVDGDEVRLIQIVGNLLENAVKFARDYGHVFLSLTQEKQEAVVRVRDDGIGIEASQLSEVFQMFTQADTTLERAKGGLGIGLGLVHSLVQMHGGSVMAKSEGLGKGSEFIVRLPLISEEQETQASQLAAAAKAPVRYGRVLVVDDNRDACDSMAQLLRTIGYDAETAYDGIAGLDAAKDLRPDIILLDLGMPRLNGFDTCRRLREQPWGKRAKVVALTGWGQAEDRRRTAEAGFDAHLLKPIDLDSLKQVLEESETKN